MPSKQTGKQRASRIPLDYFRKPTGVDRWKKMLALAALILTLGWVGSMFVLGGGGALGNKRFSHGPVCAVHAPFEAECSACHTNFSFTASKKDVNGKCQSCHLPGDTADHHAGLKESMVPNCGACHNDHKGRDFNLKRVADGDCTGCHADLKGSLADASKLTYHDGITSFMNHKEFRSIEEKKPDPSSVKFNHKYHMTEGIVLTRGGKPFTLADVPRDLRDRYRRPGQKDGDPVKLDCASCHQPEPRDDLKREGTNPNKPGSEEFKKWTTDHFAERQERRQPRLPTGELMPPHKVGGYMAPVNFETHCVACHPLTFDANLGQPSPHRVQPPELKAFLENVYNREYDRSPTTLVSRPPAPVPLPGKSPNPPTATPDRKTTVDGRVQAALRTLMEGKRVCGECHTDARGGDLTLDTQAIAHSNIPAVWFPHSRFDHSAHQSRGVNCKECHADAYATTERDLLADYALPRKGAEKVMLPGIDNCRQCHSPSPKEEVVVRSLAAKHDCTECHGYHNGALPRRAALSGPERDVLLSWLRKGSGQ